MAGQCARARKPGASGIPARGWRRAAFAQPAARRRGAERRVNPRRSSDASQPAASAPRLTAPVAFREAKARAIADFEREYIRDLLRQSGGNVSLAARLAGKERSRFNRLVRKYLLRARDFRAAPSTPPVVSPRLARMPSARRRRRRRGRARAWGACAPLRAICLRRSAQACRRRASHLIPLAHALAWRIALPLYGSRT